MTTRQGPLGRHEPVPTHARKVLGDFTATNRLLLLGVASIGIGVLSAVTALALLRLISLATNLFFFLRLSTSPVDPADTPYRWLVLVMPILGGLLVGCMARFGSERIRGHGIPEALEAILAHESRVAPRLAFLKPISAAISIGSGGPFGSEGPIIMTGGAIGSVLSQYLHLSAAERKTLLVAGAAGGMAATFAAPLAAVLLAVELLLFEWRPRSFIPVAVASATAAVVRQYLLGAGPLFPVVAHAEVIGPEIVLGAVVVGLTAGLAAIVLTGAVYRAEDAFAHVPLHWMWWPAIGGLAIGIGGMIFPPALGVGYDNIATLLEGHAALRLLVGVLLVKSAIWAISLGSGTSGGVLAPLLMIGAAVGASEAHILPDGGSGLWALVGMGAVMGGAMRSPLTGIVFSLELTHDFNAAIPLLIAVLVSHGLTVLTLRRSILTEKLARRGQHVSREYALDPLELVFVRDVMRRDVALLSVDTTIAELEQRFGWGGSEAERRSQRLFPVIEADGRLEGVVTLSDIDAWRLAASNSSDTRLLHEVAQTPFTAYTDEPLRAIAERMADCGHSRLPVIDHDDHERVVGLITVSDLLVARARDVHSEQQRERTRRLGWSTRSAP